MMRWYNIGGKIRGYQEGGAVPFTPAVETGVPQGGHAAPAIAEYLGGGAPTAPQLSYQPGVHGVDQQVQWLDQAQQVSDQLQQGIPTFAQQPAVRGGGIDPRGTLSLIHI